MTFPRLLLTLTATIGISHAAVEVNGIAAIANGKVVTKREVAFQLAPLQAQLQARFPRRGPLFVKEVNKAKDNILQELIDRELILSEFKNKLGGTLPQTAIDNEIKRQVRDLYNGDEKEFLAQLKKLGMARVKYEELTRKKLIVQAMRAQQFNDAAPPTPGEVQAEYNKVKREFRDITKDKITYEKIYIPKSIPDQVVLPEDQLTLAENIATQLKNGADFSKLALEHSTDAFADKGGKWPETPRTDLSPEFATIIFNEPKNSIIGPLEDKFGFTIVRTISTVDGPAPPLSEVKKVIESRIQKQKNSASYEKWIARIRKGAIVKRKI